jgi:hypothetical protein
MLSREGYLKAAEIILAYFKTFPKGKIIVDTHTQTILHNPLNIIPTVRTSMLMLEKQYPIIFLNQMDRRSG